MKQRLWSMVATFLLLLTGCGMQKPSTEMIRQRAAETGWKSTARVEYGELAAVCTLERQDGIYTVELTEPETVSGLRFVLDGELLTVSYGDVSFELEPDSLPVQAAAGAMLQALNNALQPYGVNVNVTETHIELSGDAEAGRFLLRLDPENGNYLSVEMPDSGFAAEFENFRFTDAE